MVNLPALLLLLGYAFVSNVAVAIVPHEPAVILAGGSLGVQKTAAVASLGTALAAYVDHRLFHRWFSTRTRPNGGSAGWLLDRFERAPFVVLVASGLLPLPVWPFKVLALSGSYPRARYVAALTLGRLPRYLLLAAFGEALALPPAVLVTVSVVFGAIFLVAPLMTRRNEMENKTATRTTDSLTAAWEKKYLPKMARALPDVVTPDHLTVLGLVAAVIVAAGYGLSTFHPAYLLLVLVGLFLHWFGDSLDGTLARVRKKTRERYGYYVDRTADAISTVLIGLGFGLSPFVRLEIAMMMTISYLLLQIYAEICAYTSREFPLSFGLFGPTEARIALGLFTFVMMIWAPTTRLFLGITGTWVDLVVALVSLGMLATFAISSWQQARRLDRLDRQRWGLVTDSGTGFPPVE